MRLWSDGETRELGEMTKIKVGIGTYLGGLWAITCSNDNTQGGESKIVASAHVTWCFPFDSTYFGFRDDIDIRPIKVDQRRRSIRSNFAMEMKGR